MSVTSFVSVLCALGLLCFFAWHQRKKSQKARSGRQVIYGCASSLAAAPGPTVEMQRAAYVRKAQSVHMLVRVKEEILHLHCTESLRLAQAQEHYARLDLALNEPSEPQRHSAKHEQLQAKAAAAAVEVERVMKIADSVVALLKRAESAVAIACDELVKTRSEIQLSESEVRRLELEDQLANALQANGL